MNSPYLKLGYDRKTEKNIKTSGQQLTSNEAARQWSSIPKNIPICLILWKAKDHVFSQRPPRWWSASRSTSHTSPFCRKDVWNTKRYGIPLEIHLTAAVSTQTSILHPTLETKKFRTGWDVERYEPQVSGSPCHGTRTAEKESEVPKDKMGETIWLHS